jgi:hypothetical protein
MDSSRCGPEGTELVPSSWLSIIQVTTVFPEKKNTVCKSSFTRPLKPKGRPLLYLFKKK